MTPQTSTPDWRREVADGVVTAMEMVLLFVHEGEEKCAYGCGEMGSCHLNLNAEARMLALYVKTITEAKT